MRVIVGGDRERGGALLAVLGVLGVLAIVGAIVAAVTMNALGFTSGTRAGVQANAAAQAGVDTTVARLLGPGCPASATVTGADPEFTATVYASPQASRPSTWGTPSCPSANTAWVRIVSTGTAVQSVGGDGAEKATLEAVYPYAYGTSAAIVSYGTPDLDNVTIGSAGSPADVLVLDGDYRCNSNSRVYGDVTTPQGTSALNSGGCRIDGTAGYATTDPVLAPGAQVTGGVHEIPPAPAPWHDFVYREADWVAQGYTITTVTASECSQAGQKVKAAAAAAGDGENVLVDASACPALNAVSALGLQLGGTLALHGDLAVVSRSFALGNLTITSADGGDHAVRFLTPVGAPIAHTGASGAPVCDFADHNGNPYNVDIMSVTMSPQVAALVYTPCQIVNTSSRWRGQMYAGTVSFQAPVSTLDPVLLGIPGVDLGSSPADGPLGDRSILRNIKG